jgi:hypothetical protein
MIDRITLFARLQVHRRATVVAELSTTWIAVVAEGAHPVAKIRGARGVGPGGRGWRSHADILSRRKDLALGLDESAPALPVTDRSGKKSEAPSEISVRLRFSTQQNQGERLLPGNLGRRGRPAGVGR